MLETKKNLRFLTPKSDRTDFPLFVFFPGMDGTGTLLKTQIDSLAKDFEVRALSISPQDLSDWDGLTDEAVALIQDELSDSPQRSIYLCGESFGGCLALKVATSKPWLFDRLILVNPASSFKQRGWLSLGVQITQWMPAFLHPGATMGLLPFLAATGRVEMSDRLALLEAMNSLPPKTVSWRLSLLRDFDVEEKDLRRLTQPVLIIAGAADLLLPSVEEGRRLSKNLPNAQTLVLPHSGHACLLERDTNLWQIMQEANFL